MATILVRRLRQKFRRRFHRLLSDEAVVRHQYKRVNGHFPDLVNPKGINEKLCWLKLNYNSQLQRECVDKLTVRDYVATCVGEHKLVPLYFTTSDPEKLTPENIPQASFVVKTTHDSGGVIVCPDRADFDWRAAQKFLRKRLRQRYHLETREPVYKGLVPRVIVEAYLPSTPEQPLLDYKLWCFGGRVEIIQLIERDETGSRHLFYDRDWCHLDIRRGAPPLKDEAPRPAALEDMIETAERLSSHFSFCRVDLYVVVDQVLFGELTFFPAGGYICFEPAEEERRLGNLLHLPGANGP